MTTFSKVAFNKIKQKKFRPLPATTLYTKEGPAVGTMWLDIELPGKKRKAHTIESVCDGVVRYDDGGWDKLEGFHACVDEGRYALVGVQQPVLAYTPKVFS